MPALARADGDPASDILIKERVFYPYQAKVPKAAASALEKTIASAREKGYSVRVAMIADQFDLGSVGLLNRKPSAYAKFLAQELAGFKTDWVLVVMPNGYGIYQCVGKQREGYIDPCEGGVPNAADEKLLRSLPTVEKSKQDYAAAGEAAVKQLAGLHGASFASPLPKLLGAAVAALVIVGGVILLLRRRRRGRKEGRDEVGEQVGHAPAGGSVVGGVEGADL
jgi:hypothetical protein